ncbi:MAG: hypothetical protein JST53_11985 [Actinobacteria bacterium]|nr:hypothetical protein [Actinomycetota bacterium]
MAAMTEVTPDRRIDDLRSGVRTVNSILAGRLGSIVAGVVLLFVTRH